MPTMLFVGIIMFILDCACLRYVFVDAVALIVLVGIKKHAHPHIQPVDFTNHGLIEYLHTFVNRQKSLIKYFGIDDLKKVPKKKYRCMLGELSFPMPGN